MRPELHQKGAGGAYACGVQLERGAGAGAFNMLGRIGREADMGNWSFSDGVALNENGVTMTGDPNGERYVCAVFLKTFCSPRLRARSFY